MTIQAIFFDMGGTIETFWHDQEFRMQATPDLQQQLTAAGIELGISDSALCQTVSDGFARYHAWSLGTSQEISTFQVWRDYVLPGYPVDLEKLSEAAEELTFWIETHYYRRTMRPEMPAVLEQIQALGLKIGLISNVCSRKQVPYDLEMYGLLRYFHPIVLSSEYGRRKPDPAIFHYAARLAGVPAGQCAYVGDRVTRDIDGARRAGFRLAIQIHHDFKHGETDQGARPDALIDDMRQLVVLLRAELQKDRDNPTGLPASHNIRAILFDAGDILYYRPKLGKRLERFLTGLDLDPSRPTREAKEALKDQAFIGLISQEDFYRKLAGLYGVTGEENIERCMQVLREEDQDICLVEGVSETLRSLKNQGFMLGIITDTAQPIHTKLSWFEKGGFGDVWDTIISSQELGVRKPNPEIYQAALDQLGVQALEAVFVGHKASELTGARAVGMGTIAFNYEPDAQADTYIEGFQSLLSLPALSLQKKELFR